MLEEGRNSQDDGCLALKARSVQVRGWVRKGEAQKITVRRSLKGEMTRGPTKGVPREGGAAGRLWVIGKTRGWKVCPRRKSGSERKEKSWRDSWRELSGRKEATSMTGGAQVADGGHGDPNREEFCLFCEEQGLANF